MPVKFWQTIVKFWFFLSYLIDYTTKKELKLITTVFYRVSVQVLGTNSSILTFGLIFTLWHGKKDLCLMSVTMMSWVLVDSDFNQREMI